VLAKLEFFFSKNVSPTLAKSISRASGFSISNDPGNYLGVPLLHQRIAKHTYMRI